MLFWVGRLLELGGITCLTYAMVRGIFQNDLRGEAVLFLVGCAFFFAGRLMEKLRK